MKKLLLHLHNKYALGRHTSYAKYYGTSKLVNLQYLDPQNADVRDMEN